MTTEDKWLPTWTSKSFPKNIQSFHRIFESDERDAVMQFRRDHEPQYIRTKECLDESMRHLIRHILLDGGGNGDGRFAKIDVQEKLSYVDDRFRWVRHDFLSIYQGILAPNAAGAVYFMIRTLLTRIAASTLSRRAAISFAYKEKYQLMMRLNGCYDMLLPIIRGYWRPEYAPIVALMVLHHGLRSAGSTAKCESCGSWCEVLEDPSGRSIYQLEHPSMVVDLDTAYQATSPQAAKTKVVQNSLLLLHALHSGDWFRFVELMTSLNLTYLQKCYAFSCLTYVRFRAVADTFGRPRPPQRARLCDSVAISFLTQKLLFATEGDCKSFLRDLGVKIIDEENNTIPMQGYYGSSNDEQNHQQPYPHEMLKRVRKLKNEDDNLESGIYLPHPDFFCIHNAQRIGPDGAHHLDLLMMIQQPDETPNQQIAGDIETWITETRRDLDERQNHYGENSFEVLKCRAPSMVGVDLTAALAEFDRLIDTERQNLAAKRISVLSENLLQECENELVTLVDWSQTELDVVKRREITERRDIIEKLRAQRKAAPASQQNELVGSSKHQQQETEKKEPIQNPLSDSAALSASFKWGEIGSKLTTTSTAPQRKDVSSIPPTPPNSATFSSSSVVFAMPKQTQSTTDLASLLSPDFSKPKETAREKKPVLPIASEPAIKQTSFNIQQTTTSTMITKPQTVNENIKKVVESKQDQPPLSLEFDPITCTYTYPQQLIFPFIDRQGYNSWLPRVIDQLKKLWISYHEISLGVSNSTSSNGFSLKKTFIPSFPEYSSKKISSLSFKPRVETDNVAINVVVVTPFDTIDAQEQTSEIKQNGRHRSLTSSITSMLYDADSCDQGQRLLCERTFVNGLLEDPRDEESICMNPTFGVSAWNFPWRKVGDICSTLATQQQKQPQNSNNNGNKNSRGILAVLVMPEEQEQQGSENDLALFASCLDDFLSGFLRQFSANNNNNNNNHFILRGVILAANCEEEDESYINDEYQKLFDEKWKGFCQKCADLFRNANEKSLANIDKQQQQQQQHKQITNNNKKQQQTQPKMSREEKLEALRRDRSFDLGKMFYFGTESNNNNKVNEDVGASSSKSEPTSLNELEQHYEHQPQPPIVVIPSRSRNVRRALGSALSDSFELVTREMRYNSLKMFSV